MPSEAVELEYVINSGKLEFETPLRDATVLPRIKI
jgi:hypothetical protein